MVKKHVLRVGVLSVLSLVSLEALTGCAAPRPPAAAAVIAPEEVAWQNLPNGARRKAWFNDHLTVALIEVTDGDRRPAPPAHQHPHEQIGYILEGRAIVTLGGRIANIAPGGVYVIPPNVPHTLKALTGRLVMLESFTPARDDFRPAVK